MAKAPAEGAGGTVTGVGNTPLIIMVLVIGFFAIPWLASGAPELVNGLLILLIVGALLLNSSVWLPYLTQLGTAFAAPAPTTGK